MKSVAARWKVCVMSLMSRSDTSEVGGYGVWFWLHCSGGSCGALQPEGLHIELTRTMHMMVIRR